VPEAAGFLPREISGFGQPPNLEEDNMSEVMIVKQSFFATVDGEERLVQAGSAISSDHPLVVADPANFKALKVLEPKRAATRAPVETATAAPGEVRVVAPKPAEAPKPAVPKSPPRKA
jgi:hypothetical protein